MAGVGIVRTSSELRLDPRPERFRIGVVVLATDHTTERDFARICPREDVGVYVNRIAYENPTTPENLAGMRPRLGDAAAMILPGEPLDALYYSCTAASVLLGDEAVEAALNEAKPGVPVITPSLAARAALTKLEVNRISILTPYLPETSGLIGDYFSSHGFEILNLVCMAFKDDREMARINLRDIVRTAKKAVAAEAEALFISCTALRGAQVAGEIEREIGRPVITSNQASIWLSLRRAGVDDPIDGFGRLLRLPAPS
ncbi:MAG TPA: ectoine utilization protein EutA [Gammaproteobacteria bacterium]|nr:ectoine utilization protein EutA [Gammaproteobacteria bacterium]